MVISLVGHSRAVTALAFSTDGQSLLSGSEDCTVHLWDIGSHQTLRIFKHSRGPISNLSVMTWPPMLQRGFRTDLQGCLINRNVPVQLTAPLSKYVATETMPQLSKFGVGPLVLPCCLSGDESSFDAGCRSLSAMERQIREFDQQGSLSAMQKEVETLRTDRQRALHVIEQWKQVHLDLHEYCVSELMRMNRDRDQEDGEKEQEYDRGNKGRKLVNKRKT
eukprot:c25282_g1_i2 orf=1105-1764(+)